MKLSVVILNYNVRYFLELCLRSVEAAISEIDAEIIVVDNDSSDDSCDMVKTAFPEVKLIKNNDNYGFSKGNNLGIVEAKGEYVCILNPDTVVAEDTFTALLAFADETENLGIIGCRLIDGNGQFLPESKRNVPTPRVSFNKLFGSGAKYYSNHLDEFATGKVDVLVGAFMLMELELYKEFGGFDEDYFMYGEDIDLSYRIMQSGRDNYYVGEHTIIHFKGESTPKNKVYRKRFYDAMGIFYRKHFRQNSLIDRIIILATKAMPLLGSNTKRGQVAGNEGNEVVFDGDHMTYKEIIQGFQERSGSLKIKPSNANFVIGSSSSKTEGEIKVLS